jgi:hypothetical protein
MTNVDDKVGQPMLTLPRPVDWTRGVRWSGQELDCSPVAVPRPNHAGRKKTSFFFEPPLNAQRLPDCGPKKRIIAPSFSYFKDSSNDLSQAYAPAWCLLLPIPSSKIALPTHKLSIYPTLKLTTHTLPYPKN